MALSLARPEHQLTCHGVEDADRHPGMELDTAFGRGNDFGCKEVARCLKQLNDGRPSVQIS